MTANKMQNFLKNKLKFPVKVKLQFDDFDIKNFEIQKNKVKSEPYLISAESGLKIQIQSPFYIGTPSKSCLIVEEETFAFLNISTEMQITQIEISDDQILEITCDSCKIYCLPGVAFGWGIYINKELVAQHYGLDEVIEFGDFN